MTSRLVRSWLCAVAVFLLSQNAFAASAKVAGRKHLSRANQLAAQGKCRTAIPEYSKALVQLKDPVILFNRGECYRKLGEAENAVADYRSFLEKVPNAPNRKTVEDRIAALAAEPAKAAPVAEAQPVAPRPEPTPLRPPARRAQEEPASPVPVEMDLDAPEPEPIRRASGGLNAEVPEIAAGPYSEDEPEKGLSTWVWVGIGAVLVAGGAAAGLYLAGRSKNDVPNSGLGNYRF